MPSFEVLFYDVVEVLDKTTIVIVGPGKLHPGESVAVLAIGRKVATTNLPLVLPKAELEIINSTDGYAVARTPLRTVGENQQILAGVTFGGPRKEREALRVDEKLLRGNPANEPIKIGDKVVRVRDLAHVPRYLAELEEEGTKA